MTAASVRAGVRRLFTDPVAAGRLTLPPAGLVVAAAVGAVFLLVVATARWPVPSDEHAYWLAARRLLAGEPLYDPTATPVTPYAYWYPPTVAQALAPLAALLPALAFTWAWTGLLLGSLWWLAGRRLLVALALVAFVPVAVELWFRNVHLVLAVLLVLAIRRWPVLFAVGAAIKVAPGIGLVYLASAGRWRELAVTAAAGGAILAVSLALAPDAWRLFADTIGARGGAGEVLGLVPIPYWVRALVGVGLAAVAGRLRPELGEPLLVVGVVVALPTLFMTGLSLLVAIVPLVRPRETRPA